MDIRAITGSVLLHLHLTLYHVLQGRQCILNGKVQICTSQFSSWSDGHCFKIDSRRRNTCAMKSSTPGSSTAISVELTIHNCTH